LGVGTASFRVLAGWNQRGRIVAASSGKECDMRIVLRIVGVLFVVFGCIWFLQGVNVLPGSFMTGQIRWAVYGGIAVLVGIGLLFAAKRPALKG
jgi:hypothetical protein